MHTQAHQNEKENEPMLHYIHKKCIRYDQFTCTWLSQISRKETKIKAHTYDEESKKHTYIVQTNTVSTRALLVFNNENLQ